MDGDPIEKETKHIDWDINAAEKGGYEHFMLKEIYEQPKAVRDTISPRIKDGQIVIEELGADDYIMKPFDSKELVARVKAVLRRYQAVPKPEVPAVDKGKCVEYPGIEINLTNYSVSGARHRAEADQSSAGGRWNRPQKPG